MKFDYAIGNPPYQIETATKETTDVTARTNIFHKFQNMIEQCASMTCLIYPAKRWIQKGGKSLANFDQINDKHLLALEVFENATDVFNNVEISDGISVVIKDMERERETFSYTYIKDGIKVMCELSHPGNKPFIFDLAQLAIVDKIYTFIDRYKLNILHDSFLPQKAFGVESNFVEQHPDRAKLYKNNEILKDGEIKILTNDVSGSAGKPKMYVIDKQEIAENKWHLFDKYKIILPSVNVCRLHQLDMLKPGEIFGRCKVGIKLFDNEAEANNFMLYMKSDIIRFCMLLTGGGLTTGGMLVPDLLNYDNNSMLDWTKDIDEQLKDLIGLTNEEMTYIQQYVNENIKQ